MREAAFFDLDKTVIAKASMAAFGRSLYDGGLINRRTALRAVYAQLVYMHLGASEEKLERIRESVLQLTKGWSRDRVCEIVDETLEEIVEPIVYREAIELIDQHRADGRLVVIVSASPEEIVVPLGRYLGADAVIASRARLDEEGRYTGAMAFYAYGPYKAEAIRGIAEERGVDLEGSYAYSDSYTDAPMLETVGHPVAVNPDRVLQKLARDRGWEIRQFVRPVRLRDRVQPSKPAVAVTIAAMGLGAGAVAVGWWLGARRPDTANAG
ncbi:MAG TPA: HAD-IB family hydrolase [Acidimicrobiales bacterium]|nr:HAD-IB family hydrolase [Acidimicrobiales bacterium]